MDDISKGVTTHSGPPKKYKKDCLLIILAAIQSPLGRVCLSLFLLRTTVNYLTFLSSKPVLTCVCVCDAWTIDALYATFTQKQL